MTTYQYNISVKSPYSHTNYNGREMKWNSVDIGAILASARAIPKALDKNESYRLDE